MAIIIFVKIKPRVLQQFNSLILVAESENIVGQRLKASVQLVQIRIREIPMVVFTQWMN